MTHLANHTGPSNNIARRTFTAWKHAALSSDYDAMSDIEIRYFDEFDAFQRMTFTNALHAYNASAPQPEQLIHFDEKYYTS